MRIDKNAPLRLKRKLVRAGEKAPRCSYYASFDDEEAAERLVQDYSANPRLHRQNTIRYWIDNWSGDNEPVVASGSFWAVYPAEYGDPEVNEWGEVAP